MDAERRLASAAGRSCGGLWTACVVEQGTLAVLEDSGHELQSSGCTEVYFGP